MPVGPGISVVSRPWIPASLGVGLPIGSGTKGYVGAGLGDWLWLLLQPVLYGQAGDSLKVPEVSCDDGEIAGQRY